MEKFNLYHNSGMIAIFIVIFSQLLCYSSQAANSHNEIITENEVFSKIQEPNDQFLSYSNRIANFHCSFLGHVKASFNISWFRNELMLNQTDFLDDFQYTISNEINSKTGFLSKLKVEYSSLAILPKELNHEFRCLFTNHLGSIRSKPAFLKLSEMSDKFFAEPLNQNVQIGQPILLTCQIHSIPKAVIEWTFQNQSISSQNSNKCTAINEFLNKTLKSSIANIFVDESRGNIDKSLKFLNLYNGFNISIENQNNFSLICAAEGIPEPKIIWEDSFDRTITESNFLFSNFTNGNNLKFKCIAKNRKTEISQIYNVVKVEAPKFNSTPFLRSYTSSQTIKIDCLIDSVPQLTTKWFKNGKPLVIDSRIRNINSRLVINHSFSSDTGYYQCFANNDFGEDYYLIYLYMNLTKKTPKSPINLTCKPYDSQTICLRWQVPKNTQPMAYSIHETSNDYSREYISIMNSYLVEKLNINQIYKYYIRLYTSQASDPSDIISCQTEPNKERNLIYKDITNTSVLIEWSILNFDVKCGSDNKPIYKFQWKRFDRHLYNSENITTNFFKIIDLEPNNMYSIQIIPLTASYRHVNQFKTIFYTHYVVDTSLDYDNSDYQEFDGTGNDSRRYVPINLKISSLTQNCLNLTWDHFDDNITVINNYSICYYTIKNDSDTNLTTNCDYDDNNLLHISRASDIQFTWNPNENQFAYELCNLKPFTMYEIRIRSVDNQGVYSPFSEPIQCETLESVPDEVVDLQWNELNETLYNFNWLPPIHMNGILESYVVSYVSMNQEKSAKNVPINQWRSVRIYEDKKVKDNKRISYNLTVDTNVNEYFLVIIQAATKVGLGIPNVPIIIKSTTQSKSHFTWLIMTKLLKLKSKLQNLTKSDVDKIVDEIGKVEKETVNNIASFNKLILLLSVILSLLIALVFMFLFYRIYCSYHSDESISSGRLDNDDLQNYISFLKPPEFVMHENNTQIYDVQEMQHLMSSTTPGNNKTDQQKNNS